MLFVVLIYRNKIIRVCPWFYFFILGRFMLDGLYLLYLLIICILAVFWKWNIWD